MGMSSPAISIEMALALAAKQSQPFDHSLLTILMLASGLCGMSRAEPSFRGAGVCEA